MIGLNHSLLRVVGNFALLGAMLASPLISFAQTNDPPGTASAPPSNDAAELLRGDGFELRRFDPQQLVSLLHAADHMSIRALLLTEYQKHA